MPHLQSFGATVSLIIGFGFLIFVHELGHFLAAKWVGIRVTQFAIGFGQCIVSWRRGLGFRRGSSEPEYEERVKAGAPPQTLGETEYRLNWLPLGGYVKMLGQDDLDPSARSDDARSFNRKPIWARACVVSAGVVMNLIFGALFFIIAFRAGVEFPPAIVGGVVPESPAATTAARGHEGDPAYQGLRPGDRITQIDGDSVTDFTDVAVKAALAGREQTLELTVERDGEPQPLIYPIAPREDQGTQLLALGISRPLSLTLLDTSQGFELPQTLRAVGVEPGMTIVRVAGQAVQRYDQFADAVSAGRGEPVTVSFADAAGERTVDVSLQAEPALAYTDDQEPHLIGLVPAIKVPRVIPGSPAARAGLRAGDLLAQIGPTAWPTWNEVVQTVQQAGSREVRMTVLRGDELVELAPATPSRDGKIGIHYGLALDTPIVARTIPQTPADQMDLNAGSRILSINGQPISSYIDMHRALTAAAQPLLEPATSTEPGRTIAVRFGYTLNVAGSPPGEAEVTIDAKTAQELAAASWSQPLDPSIFQLLMIPLAAENPLDAARLGIRKTHQVMLQTYVTLLRLFQGTVKPSHLRGPLGIADDGSTFAKQGWSYLMFFLGLISINLVVLNFLPIPVVDGGLMLFLIIEKIKGSPVSARVQHAATIIGLTLIGSVFLITLFYDAKRLLGL